MSPFDVLRDEMLGTDLGVTEDDVATFAKQCSAVSFDNTDIVFDDVTRPDFGLFITSGICAGQFAQPSGQSVIARFFVSREFCTTVPFTHRGLTAKNSIIAVTPIEGLLFPMEYWSTEKLKGEQIGHFFRVKTDEMHMFDLEMLALKTSNRIAESYSFLKERQPEVLDEVQQKLIAQFIGVTPESLSRFLNTKKITE